MPLSASPRVSVVVAAVMTRSISAASTGRQRRSRVARRQTSSIRPMPSAFESGEDTEVAGGAAGEPGLVDECAVAHGDEPVGGGGDPRVVGDDDQRLPGQ